MEETVATYLAPCGDLVVFVYSARNGFGARWPDGRLVRAPLEEVTRIASTPRGAWAPGWNVERVNALRRS